MHRLFANQLHKATDASGRVDIRKLGELVSGAYQESDRDRQRTERSIALMVEELEQTHNRLLQAIDVVPEGLAIFDAEDRYVLWNRQYADMYAESCDSIRVGTRFEETLRAGIARGQYLDAIGREDEWLAERLARHSLPSSTQEQFLPGNRWVRVEERLTPDGGSVGVRIDISALKQREASFRLLFESNPLPMLLWDRETLGFLAVNDAAIAKYGYTKEQFVAMSLPDLRRRESQSESQQLAENLQALLGCTFRQTTADGSEIEVELHAHELVYDGRRATLAAAIDVTARRRAEGELRRTQEFRQHHREYPDCRVRQKRERS